MSEFMKEMRKIEAEEKEERERVRLRDEFAKAALMSGELFDARDIGPIVGTPKFDTEARRIADVAYGLADAMLKARR